MKKIHCVLVFYFFSISLSYSQKLQYGGMQQVGLTFGENSTIGGFTLINGLRFHKFFTGLGVDAQFRRNYYSFGGNPYNTSAVFADGRYYINKKKNFFAKVNGGINIINQKMDSSTGYNNKKLAGYYSAFGLGFKARIGKEIFYSFDVSYCLRQTRFNYNYLNFRNEWQTEKYDFRQSAISINMGIEIL